MPFILTQANRPVWLDATKTPTPMNLDVLLIFDTSVLADNYRQSFGPEFIAQTQIEEVAEVWVGPYCRRKHISCTRNHPGRSTQVTPAR